MTVPSTFLAAYEKYIADALQARAEDKSEHQRKELFLSFLQQAFGIEAATIERERFIHLASDKKKGYLDALFEDLLFEFKRQIETNVDKWRSQLREYLISSPKTRSYIGILTDGLKFEVHVLDGDDLRQTDAFELKADDPQAAFIRLDSYLFSQKHVAPTSADIVGRFGGNSPTFQAAFRRLRDLLARVQATPALGLWREQWDKLLSKVYGSQVGDDDLFLRHTYLCQFAKLLASAALRGLPPDNLTVQRILSGEDFYGQGVSNIGEHDFYSWVLLDDIKDEATEIFRRIALGLVVYDLSRIDQDLLKQLYQNLVDPATRHDLGEFYTPDWLAELTLQDIDYRYPQSLLDPACGSGSFLFTAIKRLAAHGLTGWDMVSFALQNIVGVDVHPLAVTVARINYLLALVEHLQSAKPPQGTRLLLPLPVYMADALARPGEGNGDKGTLPITVDEERGEKFFIPIASASIAEGLNEVVDKMHQLARRVGDPFKLETYGQDFLNFVNKRAGQKMEAGVVGDLSPTYWRGNFRLLTKLIQEGRNGIWAYILKNQSSPLLLAQQKFDVIVGNPPWLSYRFIKNREYQADVKSLSLSYGLIESDDVKLFTQMDLSTLFFVHAHQQYLKPGGTLAFVMPRAVITGAKQHRPFQAQGFTRVIDLLGVEPLFNVPTCVMIRQGDEVVTNEVPAKHYKGRLKAHELSWAEAVDSLTASETVIRFVDSEVRGSYYYDRFQQGATLVPRNLCFVKPLLIPNVPAIITDPEADKEAKAPYKGVHLEGVVDNDYVYATLLSKHLIPFGYEKLHMVALPARLNEDGSLRIMAREQDFMEDLHLDSYDWFEKVEKVWDSLKKSTTEMRLIDRYNYQKLLSKQTPRKGIKVLYNATGTHISSCVMVVNDTTFVPHGRETQGFVVDYKTYVYSTESLDEAHYLCAFLNTPSVDKEIKASQPRGIYKGERGIERRPFEECDIPQFDPDDDDHRELTRLSQEAHQVIADLKNAGGIKGSVYTIRDQARAAVQSQLQAIDTIARRVLGL